MRDYNDRQRRNLERLELKRQLLNERLERQREQINRQLDNQQAQLHQRLNQKQERIIEVALKLLDQDGLNNLSLRRLAAQLDMQAPGLYWHFKNKETLIDYLAEEILNEEFQNLLPCGPAESWQEWLTSTMNRLRQVMLRHTDGARVVAGAHLFPAITLGKIFELSIQALHDAGFDLLTGRNIMVTATTYTFGYVIEEQASPSAEDVVNLDRDDWLKDYPLMIETMKLSQQSDISGAADFNAGLQLIIGGASQITA